MNGRSEPKLIRYRALVAFVECRNFCLNNENYLDLRTINTKTRHIMRQSTRAKNYPSFVNRSQTSTNPRISQIRKFVTSHIFLPSQYTSNFLSLTHSRF